MTKEWTLLEPYRAGKTLIILVILLLAINLPSIAAEQTQRTATSNNAIANLNWSVSPAPTFETFSQELTLKKLDLGSSTDSGWNNWFHTTLCWTKGSSFQSSGDSCMWFGLGLLAPRARGYLATFDFTFNDGKDFRKTSTDENLNCRRESNAQGANAYTTCSLSVQVQLDTKYVFELSRDNALGISWWKLRVKNSSTNETVNLGSIEASYFTSTSELTTAYNHIGYGGKSVPCKEIPNWDMLISQPRVNGRAQAFRSLDNGACITTHLSFAPSVSTSNYLLMIGGATPSLRDQSFRFIRAFFTGNNMNIELNLGSEVADTPEKVFLSAPQLGIQSNNPLLGRIDGKVATWSIPFEKSLGGSIVNLEAFGELEGKRFTSARASYVLPGVKCPQVSDSQPDAAQPKVLGFTFTGTNQKFVRVDSSTLEPVSNAGSLVGCYLVPEMINFESPDWQIGSISRDLNGFYFVNGAGIKWRLTLIDDGTRLENDLSAPYYSEGRFFNLNFGPGARNSASGLTDSKPSSQANSSTRKPTKPTFSAVSFVGNKLNINVNLGSSAASRPDKVYLVAPKLGIKLDNPIAGVISGNSATWSLEFDRLLAGQPIALEIIGEKDGVKSESLVGEYEVPSVLSSLKTTSTPVAPTNFKSRIVGNSALITVEASPKPGAIASRGFLFGKSLGISKSQAIEGDVVGNKVVLEVPIKTSMAGKKFPVTIFLTNDKGESKPLNAILSVPVAPKVPSLPTAIPTPKVPKTVICIRANQTRAFEGTSCPPGWEKR